MEKIRLQTLGRKNGANGTAKRFFWRSFLIRTNCMLLIPNYRCRGLDFTEPSLTGKNFPSGLPCWGWPNPMTRGTSQPTRRPWTARVPPKAWLAGRVAVVVVDVNGAPLVVGVLPAHRAVAAWLCWKEGGKRALGEGKKTVALQ